MNRRNAVLAATAAIILGLGVWWVAAPGGEPRGSDTNPIVVPASSAATAAGEDLFNAKCAVCHGANAAGTDKGPPLVHRLYVPGHHADVAFQLAARNGVRAHHWRFGNMPPVEGITEAEVTAIVAYVRAVQRANGIE